MTGAVFMTEYTNALSDLCHIVQANSNWLKKTLNVPKLTKIARFAVSLHQTQIGLKNPKLARKNPNWLKMDLNWPKKTKFAVSLQKV